MPSVAYQSIGGKTYDAGSYATGVYDLTTDIAPTVGTSNYMTVEGIALMRVTSVQMLTVGQSSTPMKAIAWESLENS